jgi:hypothetical protein
MTTASSQLSSRRRFHHVIVAVIELGGLAAEWRDEFRPAVTTRNLGELVA